MKITSKEKPTDKAGHLRELAAELRRRRDHIAAAQRARAVLAGAYDLVLTDLDAVHERLLRT